MGNADEWEEEYHVLCLETDADPAEGLDVNMFWRLVDDPAEAGCYCSDDELYAVIASLRAQGASSGRSFSGPQTRAELVSAVFEACDEGDGFLNSREMLRFA